MSTESAVETLVRFARLASEAGTGSSVLPALAEALTRQEAADGVAIVEIRDDGTAHLVDTSHCPAELRGVEVDADEIGDELGRRFLRACAGRFAAAHCRPLVAGGGLFGCIVMFFTAGHSPAQLSLADGLVDLAAIALGSAAKVHQLARANAELRASHDVLARTEKLRALGQMAAGVSHDLKNILNPLSLHLQLLDRALAKGDAALAKEACGEMKQALVRGLQVLELLRDYSRQTPSVHVEAVDLNRLVHEASEIAKPRMAARGGRANRIVEELATELPPVGGRPAEIVSALVNLIVNAIDAMPDGGTIRLRTSDDGATSTVQVADEGPGMPPEVQARVFEPFFTTKGGDGTGLGLAMVYACMRRHGGSVHVDSAPGKGTTFTLSFPRT